MNNKLVVVFGLDDTLYQEIDFLKSAFQEIADVLGTEVADSFETLYRHMIHCYQKGDHAFQSVLQLFHMTNYKVTDLLHLYRNHRPLHYLNKSQLSNA